MVDGAAQATPRCQRLVAWVTEHGGFLHPDVELVEDGDHGLHVRARRKLPTLGGSRGASSSASASDGDDEGAEQRQQQESEEEITICTCPAALSLSHLNASAASAHPGTPIRHTASAIAILLKLGFDPATAAHFFLAEQRLLAERSFWAPYLACLPAADALTTPLYFDEEDQAWLRGTNVLAAIEARRDAWRGNWKLGCRALESGGVDVRTFTWEIYQWAASIFSSRSFTSNASDPGSGGFPILYPLVDCLNHRVGERTVWRFDRGDFTLATTRSYEAGEEIYNNYAPKGNEELLMGYGFALPDNPCETFSIRLGQIPAPVIDALLTHGLLPRIKTDPTTLATFALRGRNHYSRYPYPAALAPYLGGLPPLMLATVVALVLLNRDIPPTRPLLTHPPLRLLLAALLQLLPNLRRKAALLDQTNPTRPPANPKQRAAAIYRATQRAVLADVEADVEALFRALRPAGADLPQALRLHQNKTGCTLSLAQAQQLLALAAPAAGRDFRAGLTAGFGTADPAALRAPDLDAEDAAWVLWVCCAWVVVDAGCGDDGEPAAVEALRGVVGFLRGVVGEEEVEETGREEEEEEHQGGIRVMREVVRDAMGEGAVGSVWGDEKRWTAGLIGWAERVVGEVGFAWPVEGEEELEMGAWVMYVKVEPEGEEDGCVLMVGDAVESS